MDVALIYAKENAGNLSPKYKECLEIADRALADRALAEEIVQKGFGQCDAVKAVCKKHTPEVSREPMGLSTSKSAKEIGAVVVAGMNDMHTWPDAFQKWPKAARTRATLG